MPIKLIPHENSQQINCCCNNKIITKMTEETSLKQQQVYVMHF